jgi:4-hydroxy-tetrahydrodipicolinate synthase
MGESFRPEVSAAAATPITRDGRCHRPLYLAHLRDLLARGCDSVVLFGTTGEGPAFSVAERCAVLDDVLAAGLPPERLVLAAMSAAPADCLALCRHGLASGVHRLLVMPPFFFRGAARPAGLERFYGDLIEALGASELRLLLYHFPEMSGAAMDAGFVDGLRRRHGAVIDGLKDSTGDLAQTLGLIRDLPGLRVLVGTEVQVPEAVAAGGAGTICGLANAAPEVVRAIAHATDPGEIAELAARLDAIEAGFGDAPFVVGLKHFLAEATGTPEWAQPMPPLSAK